MAAAAKFGIRRSSAALAAALWLATLGLAHAGEATCVEACALARSKVAALVARFEADIPFHTSRRFNEAETRARLIDPFFEALGWDVRNLRRQALFRQDTIPEARLRIARAMHYADYAFRIDARTQPVFLTTATASVDLGRVDRRGEGLKA